MSYPPDLGTARRGLALAALSCAALLSFAAPGRADGAAGIVSPNLAASGGTVVPAAAHPHSIWGIGGNGAGCADAPFCADGGPATQAPIGFPQGSAVDGAGDVFVADYADSEVREISPRGTITVVAGSGSACASAPACGDGGPATSAQLSFPTAVAVDSRGELFIADAGDEEIRMVAKGIITRVAGTGGECQGGSCGDGTAARSATLNSPDGVAVDGAGNLFIADTGDDQVREVSRGGTISTIAGDGSPCSAAPACGDGGPAISAELTFPEAVALDTRGRVYVADDGDNEIRQIDRGKITRLAGTGAACAAAPACGDGGQATSAALSAPQGVAVDRAGEVFVADWGDNEVREVSHGKITRLAGSALACAAPPACGDGGSALGGELSGPHGVAVDGAGNLYVADTGDDEIRLVPATTAAPARIRATQGSLDLLALSSQTGSHAVAVRYLVNASASVSLWVTPRHGRALLAARAHAAAGRQELDWNRRLGRLAAPRGRYTLTVMLTAGRVTIASSVTVTL